jgi:hypothetical protein
MSNEHNADIPIARTPALAEQLDPPSGRDLFPVMAVLLAQVLDLDQTTKESSR